jgi:hypothetical protein
MQGIERARRVYLSFPILPIGVAFAYAECVIGREEGDEFDRASTKMRYAAAPNTDTLCFNARTRIPRRPTQRVGYAPGARCTRLEEQAIHAFCCPWLARCTEPHGAILRSAISRGSGRLHTVGGTGRNYSCNVMDLVVHAPYTP